MRISVTLSVLVGVAALLAGGCAQSSQKLGRGMSNMGEIVRGGEMMRSVEQAGIWDGRSAVCTGFVRGAGRTLARTGVGIYEVVTAPIPPYGPVFKPTKPPYPDNYKPGLLADTIFAPNTNLGFGGGEVCPFPGSRFTIFGQQ